MKKRRPQYSLAEGYVETLVFVFGTQMARTTEPMNLMCECPPKDLAPHLGEGALAFQIVQRDVLDYYRGSRGPYQALGPLRDPSGIYYPRGFILSEGQCRGLYPRHQEAIALLLRQYGDELRFVVVPDGEGHRILPFWSGDVLLEAIPVPDHFPRAIDFLWFWPDGQIRFGLRSDGSLMMGAMDRPV